MSVSNEKQTEGKTDTRGQRKTLPGFSSEFLLQQAIAGLLMRMPKVTGVQVLHGPQEYGKDLIFNYVGALGERMPCACIVKNTKISGKVGDSQRARAVLEQVEQALGIAFLDASGEETLIHRAYVFSPYEITQSAINSIRGKLRERSGQVMFVGGSSLFQLFRQYWPDFFADEHVAIEAYLERLLNQSRTTPLMGVASLYGLGEVDKSEMSIYVERSLYRELPRYKLRSMRETTLIPTDGALLRAWNKQQLQDALERLCLLQILLNFLRKWEYKGLQACDHCKRGNHGSSADVELLSSIGNSLEAISKLLEELGGGCVKYRIEFLKQILKSSWVRDAGNKAGQEGVSLEQVTSKMSIKLADSSFLQECAESLAGAIDRSLRRLYEACQSTRSISKVRSGDLSCLFQGEWQVASRLDECLRAAPYPIFESHHGFCLEVEEEELRRFPGDFLVSGPPGYGKTCFCRRNVLADAEDFRSGKSMILPVYVPLHTLGESDLRDFASVFLRGLGRSALLPDASADDAFDIRLYLDGLDEVPSQEKQRQIVDLAKSHGHISRTVHIVVTARDHVSGSWLARFPRLNLKGLSSVQIERLEIQWFREDTILRREFDEQLRQSLGLKALMQIPLLATLTILVFRRTKRLPENKARLYNIFTELLSGGWDLAKGVFRGSNFGQVDKVMALAEIGMRAHIQQKRQFDRKYVDSAISRALSNASPRMREQLRDELIVDGILTKSGNQYFFAHLSFQEFLAAKYMAGDPGDRSIARAFANFLKGEHWWTEVLRFYIGLSQNPGKMTEWLLGQLDKHAGVKHGEQILSMVRESFLGFDLISFLRERGRQDWLNACGEKLGKTRNMDE
jgi:hypothetical protein